MFGKEADKLEQSNDDDKTCILVYLDFGILVYLQTKLYFRNWATDYIIEKEALVNKFISRQKDKGSVVVFIFFNACMSWNLHFQVNC